MHFHESVAMPDSTLASVADIQARTTGQKSLHAAVGARTIIQIALAIPIAIVAIVAVQPWWPYRQLLGGGFTMIAMGDLLIDGGYQKIFS